MSKCYLHAVILYCLATMFFYAHAAAQTHPKTVVSASNFKLSGKPPPGFERLEEKQQTVVDVYFAGLFVGTYEATFTPTSIEFDTPDELAHSLRNLSNIKKVQQAFTGTLKTNTHLLCQSRYQQNCGVIKPKVAAVIFNPSTYRADIFVNPKYIKGALRPSSLLLPSTVGLSYANDIKGTLSGMNNSNSYNIYSRNVLAFHQARINTDVSYARNNDAHVEQWQMSNLNAGWNYDRYEVQAGAISTRGDILIPGQYVMGASWGTSMDTIINEGNVFGSPLEVFLNNPSKVSIYRDGRLLSSGFYPAGKQLINTSSLPEGAYEVTLEIEGSNGVKTEESQFYAKTSQIPPLRFPTYYVTAGYLQKNNVFDTTLPEYSHTFLAEAGMAKRLAPSWGVSAAVVGEGIHNYLTGGFFYLGHGWQLNPDFLYGSKGEYGIAMNSIFNWGPWYSSLYGRRIWSHYSQSSSTDENAEFVSSDVDFAPIVGDTSLLGASLSRSFGKVSLSFMGSFNKRTSQGDTYNYGPSLRMPLLNKNSISVNLELSATKSSNDAQYLATIRVDYRPRESNWYNSASLGYQGYQTDTQTNKPGMSGSANSTWSNFNSAQEGWQARMFANHNPAQGQVGTDIRYNHLRGSADAQVQRNFINNSNDNTQYTASFATHVTMTGKTTAIGGAQSGDTGVIVDIHDPQKSAAKFQVIVNNQMRKTAIANIPTLVILQPYQTYKIQIQSIGKKFYDYSQAPEIVTLYRGNIKTLEWDIKQKVILFTKIMLSDGTPLKDRLIKGGIGVNETDSDGSLQAEISSETKQLHARLSDKQSCTIHLPDYKIEDGIAMLDNLVCEPNKTT